MRKKIAIVGSGPSSWATFQILQRLHGDCCEITILDANKRESYATVVPTIASKTKMGSTHMYEPGDGIVEFETPNNFSLANGGLSTVWGAGIRMWDQEYLLQYGSLSEIYNSAIGLLDHLPYSGDNSTLNIPNEWKVSSTPRPPGSSDFSDLVEYSLHGISSFPTALAVDVKNNNKCVGCGECLSGCTYGSIFDAGNFFDKYLAQKLIKRQDFFVEKIVLTTGNVELHGLSGGKTQKVECFDEIHLCAGAIGTPAILLRSNLIPERKLKILDSQVFFFMGLKKFKKNHSSLFALSQITISSNSSKNIEFKASLYRSNKDIRSRASQVIKKVTKLQILLPKFIDNFLFVGIGFLNSNQSGFLEIVEENEEIILNTRKAKKENARSAVRSIRKFLLSKKMFVFPALLEMPSPGLGFHSGGALSLNSELVDDYGRLRFDTRVRISDVSILKSIPAGPHTFSSMAIVSATIKGEYENSSHGI